MNGAGFRWDDGLEGPARRVAELDHNPMRVLAGPGTGKTFALMRRIARLLQQGARPNRVLVCTFTRTAARDLEGELARLGVNGVEQVRAGTLHAFCFGLLGRAEVLQATGRVPRPLLQFEERFLLEDLNGDGFGGIRDRDRRLQAFNAAWARLQSEPPGWPADPVDKAFHQELVGWLRFHQAMLIGELVPETLRYLRENPASPHRRAFDHVLVDEYQDLNRAEQVLLDLLAEAGHLIVIGDEDPSIRLSSHTRRASPPLTGAIPAPTTSDSMNVAGVPSWWSRWRTRSSPTIVTGPLASSSRSRETPKARCSSSNGAPSRMRHKASLRSFRRESTLAKNPNFDIEFYDESVRAPFDSQNAEYIKRRIREKINRTSVTVCLISEETHKSKWVDWELRVSAEKGNKIIAMALKGVDRAVLPSLIKEKQLTFHSWDIDKLESLI